MDSLSRCPRQERIRRYLQRNMVKTVNCCFIESFKEGEIGTLGPWRWGEGWGLKVGTWGRWGGGTCQTVNYTSDVYLQRRGRRLTLIDTAGPLWGQVQVTDLPSFLLVLILVTWPHETQRCFWLFTKTEDSFIHFTRDTLDNQFW